MNTLYIQPRQSGKTTKLVESFRKNIESSILVVKNYAIKQYLIRNHFALRESENKILTVEEFCNRKRWVGCPFLDVYIDEYLFFSIEERKKLYDTYLETKRLHFRNKVTWEIRTTSNILYKRDLLDLTNEIKQCQNPQIILKNLKRDIDGEYWYNFITEPDWRVVRQVEDFELPIEQHRLERLGEFIE